MKKNKALYISLILIVFFTLVLSASFAWFSVTLQSKGNTIKTGKFKYSVVGYNKANSGVEKVSTLLSPLEIEREEYNETDLTNMMANAPIIDTVLNPGDIYSTYVSIEFLTGSIDFDYAVSFTVDTNEGNPDYLGAFTFRVEDITSAVSAKSGANIAAKIGAYADSLSPVTMPTNSMSNIEQFRAQGSLTSSSNPNYKVYRIDVAMNDGYSSFSYTDLEFVSNVNVVVGQVGTLDDSQTSSQNTFYVSSKSELDYALANIRNKDIIQFVSSFEYDKDLSFTNSVNIVFSPGVYCKVLGNVNFEYSSTLESSIKSDGNEKSGFIVKNNFNFSAPNGSLLLEASSNNTYGLITTGGNINIQANRQDGVLINGAKFKATEVNGNNIDATTVDKPVYIGSNTFVDVSSISEIYKIVSMNRANNIKISVKGKITDQIDLSSMFNNNQNEYPQIEIIQYSQFGLSINLPTWSRTWISTYDEATHTYSNVGNTKISRSINSGAITFLGTSVEVEYDAISGDNYVVDNDTSGTFANQNKDLTVYYQDKYKGVTPQGTLDIEEQSLHTILVNYFKSLIMASPATYSVDVSNQAQVDAKINSLISNITKLTIESKGKALKSVNSSTDVDVDDFYFIRILSNDLENSHLVYLDLSLALLEDNTLPFSALYNTRKIENLILPTSCVALGQQSLMNCGATEITIPQSVTAFGNGCLSGANIIHISSYIEPTQAENMASWTQSAGITEITPIILVSRNLYDTYVKNHVNADGITYTNNFMNFLFVDGILDHSKKYILEV
ncbi:MAG: leucine-rich repeat domain-containing protein, partial [Gammaproteobacteria bacterium]|nr:leucine-rich repeat domain-containing protein [Gammaproteobacteria bacterium]